MKSYPEMDYDDFDFYPRGAETISQEQSRRIREGFPWMDWYLDNMPELVEECKRKEREAYPEIKI